MAYRTEGIAGFTVSLHATALWVAENAFHKGPFIHCILRGFSSFFHNVSLVSKKGDEMKDGAKKCFSYLAKLITMNIEHKEKIRKMVSDN